MNVAKDTIIRTIAMALALLNQVLVGFFGFDPFPFDSEAIYAALSTVATVAATILVWWKDNPFTPESIEGTALTRKLKNAQHTKN